MFRMVETVCAERRVAYGINANREKNSAPISNGLILRARRDQIRSRDWCDGWRRKICYVKRLIKALLWEAKKLLWETNKESLIAIPTAPTISTPIALPSDDCKSSNVHTNAYDIKAAPPMLKKEELIIALNFSTSCGRANFQSLWYFPNTWRCRNFVDFNERSYSRVSCNKKNKPLSQSCHEFSQQIKHCGFVDYDFINFIINSFADLLLKLHRRLSFIPVDFLQT